MKIFTFITLFFLTTFAYSQCIVINEILIDGGDCDGSCNPNTSEWVELYNTCNSSVDIGCYIICDGDWTYVIPEGTTLGAYGFLTIGGATNESTSPDLLWDGANYTGTGGIGTFTNGGEQLALFDASGSMIDGVVWGGGQGLSDNSNAVTSSGGCTVTNVSLPSAGNSAWEVLPSDANDCTLARDTDGSSTWERRCRSDGDISFGTSNGGSVPMTFVEDSINIPFKPIVGVTKRLLYVFDIGGQQLSTNSLDNISTGLYIVHYMSSEGDYTREKVFIIK